MSIHWRMVYAASSCAYWILRSSTASMVMLEWQAERLVGVRENVRYDDTEGHLFTEIIGFRMRLVGRSRRGFTGGARAYRPISNVSVSRLHGGMTFGLEPTKRNTISLFPNRSANIHFFHPAATCAQDAAWQVARESGNRLQIQNILPPRTHLPAANRQRVNGQGCNGNATVAAQPGRIGATFVPGPSRP
jgi:hypothetical protein